MSLTEISCRWGVHVLHRAIVLGLLDTRNGYTYLGVARAFSELVDIDLVLEPLALHSNGRIIFYDTDYYGILLDKVEGIVRNSSVKSLVLLTPVAPKDVYGDFIDYLKSICVDNNIPLYIQLSFKLPYTSKSLVKILKLDVEEYIGETISNSSAVIVDNSFYLETSGSRPRSMELRTTLASIAKEYNVRDATGFTDFIGGKGFAAIYDPKNQVYVDDFIPSPFLFETPWIRGIASELASEKTRVHGLDILLVLSIHYVRSVYRRLNCREVLGFYREVVDKSFFYWRRVASDKVVDYIASPLASIKVLAERYMVLDNIGRSLTNVIENQSLLLDYIPSSGSNIVMALPHNYVRDVSDVAGPDRIIRVEAKGLLVAGRVRFGSSRFLAKLLMSVMSRNKRVRAVMSLRYNPLFIDAAVKQGVTAKEIKLTPPPNREPWRVSREEIIEYNIERITSAVPKDKNYFILYYTEALNSEPAMMFFGPTATDIVSRVIGIARMIREMYGKTRS